MIFFIYYCFCKCELYHFSSLTHSHLFFLDVPKEQRLQAVRSAILLMPDENREVLQMLLYFLRDVTSLVEENQMTPMNLAVCLGPSLFHLSILKNDTLSPRCVCELMSMSLLTKRNPKQSVFLLPVCMGRINNATYVVNTGKGVSVIKTRSHIQPWN